MWRCTRLEELALGVTEYFREISPCMSVLSASGIPPQELMARFDTPPPIAAIRTLTGWLEQCAQKEMIRQANFEATAMAILGSLNIPSFLTYVVGKKPSALSRREYIEEFVELYVRGLTRTNGGKRG